MKTKLHLWLASFALVAYLTGCATNANRANLNATDSIVTAVNLAERAWTTYTVSQAKADLAAAGNAAPTVAQLTAQVNTSPTVAKVTTLDADYRAAMATYIQAMAAYEQLKQSGSTGVLDPAFRDRAVQAANALIDAVALITGKTLNPAQ